jgi:hypothetical protein
LQLPPAAAIALQERWWLVARTEGHVDAASDRKLLRLRAREPAYREESAEAAAAQITEIKIAKPPA